MGRHWKPPVDEKPYWQILREREEDLEWKEPGTYSFACDHCSRVSTKELAASKSARRTTTCAHCRRRTAL